MYNVLWMGSLTRSIFIHDSAFILFRIQTTITGTYVSLCYLFISHATKTNCYKIQKKKKNLLAIELCALCTAFNTNWPEFPFSEYVKHICNNRMKKKNEKKISKCQQIRVANGYLVVAIQIWMHKFFDRIIKKNRNRKQFQCKHCSYQFSLWRSFSFETKIKWFCKRGKERERDEDKLIML